MEIRLAEYSPEKAGGGSSTPYLASIIQDFSTNRVLSLLRTQSFEWPRAQRHDQNKSQELTGVPEDWNKEYDRRLISCCGRLQFAVFKWRVARVSQRLQSDRKSTR